MVWSICQWIFFKLYLNFIGAYNVVKDAIWDRHNPLQNFPSQSDKTIVFTGGSRGIGLEAVRKLLKLDCNVILGVRDVEAVKKLFAEEKQNSKAEHSHEDRLTVLHLDLMSLQSVRKFAQDVIDLKLHINILVNNAGIMFGARKETGDGLESQLATNYLGHFLLTHLLLPELEKNGNAEFPARIVNVSSIAHYLGSWMDFDDLQLRKFYSPEQSYGNSKAAQVMFSKYLDSILQSQGKRVRVNCVHPGIVYTGLYANVSWVQIFTFLARLIMKTAAQGSDTVVHAALAPELSNIKTHGAYLDNSKSSRNSSFTGSLENQARLWQLTCDLLKIEEF